MGFRFWKRVNVLPGVQLNLSKSGASVSVGPKGAKFTMGPGGKRVTFGIPGTGLFWTKQFGKPGEVTDGKPKNTRPVRHEIGDIAGELGIDDVDLLLLPDDERKFVEGCRALAAGDPGAAYEKFDASSFLADSAFFAGILALVGGDPEAARRHLDSALLDKGSLAYYTDKHDLAPLIDIPVIEGVTAHVTPCARGVRLALVEANQELGDAKGALEHLKALRKLSPDDPVVTLSLVELMLEVRPGDKRVARQVDKLVGIVENETLVDTGLIYHRARALRTLGLNSAARGLCTEALRRRKDRPPILLAALRYERGCCAEALGEAKKARADFEAVYALDPGYEDVAERLGA